jgi:hypothetical protein
VSWSDTPAALARLKALDPELMVVGASVHKYELNPSATDEEMMAWELTCGVRLPADYRAFLLEVGNGGPGPGQGLLPYDAEWDRGDPGVEYSRGALNGLLPLCKYDGNSHDMLMVNGPKNGTVWNLTSGVLDDWYNPDGSGLMTFRPWYEGWVAQMTMALAD